jgi:drug/metabolite transporter (DMT)-like permease
MASTSNDLKPARMLPGNLITSIGTADMLIYYVVLGVGILAGIAGQMLLKAGSDAPTLVEQVFRPSSLLGLALYGSAAFMYMFAIRKIPLSVAFPSVSLSYVIVALLAFFLFGEPFGWKQGGGIALIVGGVILINQT